MWNYTLWHMHGMHVLHAWNMCDTHMKHTCSHACDMCGKSHMWHMRVTHVSHVWFHTHVSHVWHFYLSTAWDQARLHHKKSCSWLTLHVIRYVSNLHRAVVSLRVFRLPSPAKLSVMIWLEYSWKLALNPNQIHNHICPCLSLRGFNIEWQNFSCLT